VRDIWDNSLSIGIVRNDVLQVSRRAAAQSLVQPATSESTSSEGKRPRYEMDSLVKKRRKKMRKHKLKKFRYVARRQPQILCVRDDEGFGPRMYSALQCHALLSAVVFETHSVGFCNCRKRMRSLNRKLGKAG
jgi:hypothetical protein